jgi:uncharacterized membrane protein YeaQ/YmgE (transglycosylase-associated protein family)
MRGDVRRVRDVDHRGLFMGVLASIAAKDGSRGLILDVTLSLGGSLTGSTLFELLGGSQDAGWFVMAAMMCVGAAGLIAGQRTAWPRRI